MWGWGVPSLLVIGLLIAVGHPMALGFGYLGFELVYAIVIFNVFPKEPRTYRPDPLEERYLP